MQSRDEGQSLNEMLSAEEQSEESNSSPAPPPDQWLSQVQTSVLAAVSHIQNAVTQLQNAVSAVNDAKEFVREDKKDIRELLTQLDELSKVQSDMSQKLSEIVSSQGENETRWRQSQDNLFSEAQARYSETLSNLKSENLKWRGLKDELSLSLSQVQRELSNEITGVVGNIGGAAKKIVTDQLAEPIKTAKEAAKSLDLAERGYRTFHWCMVGGAFAAALALMWLSADIAYGIRLKRRDALQVEVDKLSAIRKDLNAAGVHVVEVSGGGSNRWRVILDKKAKIVEDRYNFQNGRWKLEDGREILDFYYKK